MDKFGRNYALSVGAEDGSTITITLPFTIEFDITRNTLSSANVCQIRIYNLSPENRNKIRFNAYDYATYRTVQLRAGYGDNLSVIFAGNVTQAWSVREGVDFITQIECYDGGFAYNNGATSGTFVKNTDYKDVIDSLIGDLPHVQRGAVGSFPGLLLRGNTYDGNTANLLRETTGGAFFIDNQKAYVLGTNEYVATPQTLTIDSRAGLLGTPVLEQYIVRFDMIFEPSLNVGIGINLISFTEQNFNGFYKVNAVKHRGMISAAVCGQVVTTGEFYKSKSLEPVTP